METIFSNICRINNDDVLDFVNANFSGAPVALPNDVLPARQIRINTGVPFNVALTSHRGETIITISSAEAARLVNAGEASYEEQSALVYSREDYLGDKDVIADTKEFERVSKSDATHIMVAVIGTSRSALAVCRNIVSGCSKLDDSLVKDAEKALAASSVILIEN